MTESSPRARIVIEQTEWAESPESPESPESETPKAIGSLFRGSTKYRQARSDLRAVGDEKRGAGVIDELTEPANRRFVSPADLARIYAALGEKARAFDWLTKACEERAGWLIYLKVEPVFDGLRSDHRFVAVLRRLNFPQT